MLNVTRGTSRAAASRLSLCLVAALLAVAAWVSTAQATVQSRTAGMENGGLNEFDQASVTSGTLGATTERAYEGRYSAKATYNGSGVNGYSRGIDHVNWQQGDDLWYGAAYFLPNGYLASDVGGNDIMRWDNYGAYGAGGDVGGIEIWSDHKAGTRSTTTTRRAPCSASPSRCPRAAGSGSRCTSASTRPPARR